MQSMIEEKRVEITKLCHTFQVKRLDLFGSAARGDFQDQSSDLDFVVSFAVEEPTEYSRCYFGLAHGLEELFQRSIDLITETSIQNPYFRQTIDNQRQMIYAN